MTRKFRGIHTTAPSEPVLTSLSSSSAHDVENVATRTRGQVPPRLERRKERTPWPSPPDCSWLMESGKVPSPYRFAPCVLVALALVSACGGGFTEKISPNPSPEDMRSYVERWLSGNSAPGAAACIVKDGEIAWCQGFGMAHVESQRTVTADTPFLLASITKTITGVAAMQLVETGEIGLDDSVERNLPFELAHPHSDRPITYFDLLTHTAGIADDWDTMKQFYGWPEDPDVQALPPFTLAEVVEGYFSPTGRFHTPSVWRKEGPGERYSYSNMGFALLGYAIARVTGTDFAKLCKERIFEPLNMSHTSLRWSELASEAAMPYGKSAYGYYGFADTPDGAARSSARDLARFVAMLASGGTFKGAAVLAQKSVESMLSAQIGDLNPDRGLAFVRTEILGRSYWGHSGFSQGAATEMYFRPDDGFGIVFLTNSDVPEVGAMNAMKASLVIFGEVI